MLFIAFVPTQRPCKQTAIPLAEGGMDESSIHLCCYLAVDVFSLWWESSGSLELPLLSSHPRQVFWGLEQPDPMHPGNYHLGSGPSNPRGPAWLPSLTKVLPRRSPGHVSVSRESWSFCTYQETAPWSLRYVLVSGKRWCFPAYWDAAPVNGKSHGFTTYWDVPWRCWVVSVREKAGHILSGFEQLSPVWELPGSSEQGASSPRRSCHLSSHSMNRWANGWCVFCPVKWISCAGHIHFNGPCIF